MENKSDKIIWQIMMGASGIVLLGAIAWANNINNKVEKIAGMEVNIQYIQTDIARITALMERYTNNNNNFK